jgi:hypothetical protein
MREQVCVINQRPCGRFSVVKYASAAFRYLVTGIVALVLALLLVLLIVELGAAIGAALEHDMPASIIAENPLRAQSPQRKEFLWRVGVEVRFVYDRADFGSATL